MIRFFLGLLLGAAGVEPPSRLCPHQGPPPRHPSNGAAALPSHTLLEQHMSLTSPNDPTESTRHDEEDTALRPITRGQGPLGCKCGDTAGPFTKNGLCEDCATAGGAR